MLDVELACKLYEHLIEEGPVQQSSCPRPRRVTVADHPTPPTEPMEEELAKQVEYDMDEQGLPFRLPRVHCMLMSRAPTDQIWLDGINADRKRDGEKPVSLEAFEIIFDKLEKEWFDLVRASPPSPAHSVADHPSRRRRSACRRS